MMWFMARLSNTKKEQQCSFSFHHLVVMFQKVDWFSVLIESTSYISFVKGVCPVLQQFTHYALHKKAHNPEWC